VKKEVDDQLVVTHAFNALKGLEDKTHILQVLPESLSERAFDAIQNKVIIGIGLFPVRAT
jgi:hypothetical protein